MTDNKEQEATAETEEWTPEWLGNQIGGFSVMRQQYKLACDLHNAALLALQERLTDRHKLTVHYEQLYKQTRDELSAVNQAAENMAREADCETKALQRKNEELVLKVFQVIDEREALQQRLDKAEAALKELKSPSISRPV